MVQRDEAHATVVEWRKEIVATACVAGAFRTVHAQLGRYAGGLTEEMELQSAGAIAPAGICAVGASQVWAAPAMDEQTGKPCPDALLWLHRFSGAFSCSQPATA